MLLGTFVSQVNCNNKAALGKNKEHRRACYFLKKGEEERNRRSSRIGVVRVSSSLVSRSLRPVEETRGGQQQQQQPLITRRANKKSTRKVTSIKAKTDVVLSSNDNKNHMLKSSVPSLVSGLVLGSLLLLFANKSLQHWQENRPTR